MDFRDKLKKLRHSKWFSNLTTVIIILYASLLGFKTIGDITTHYAIFLSYFDYIITIYFIIELTIKLSTEDKMIDFFKSGWNIFDFVIIVITLIPMGETNIAAIARLLRIFRVLRLITARPELKRIIDVLIGVIPSIIDIVILLFIIFYIYAIIGNFLFADAPSGLWKDFLVSMLTLFRVLTLEGWTDVMYEAMILHSWAWVYFVSFVIIAAFIFFNLFVAVIINEMEKSKNEDIEKELHDDNMKLDKLLDGMNEMKREIRDLKKEIKKE